MLRNLIIVLSIVFLALITASVGIASLSYVPVTTPPFADYANIMPGNPAQNAYTFAGDIDTAYFHFDNPFTYITLTPYSKQFARRIFVMTRKGIIVATSFRIAPGLVLSDMTKDYGYPDVQIGTFSNWYRWGKVLRAAGGGREYGYGGFAARNALVPLEYVTFLGTGYE